ncbi:MAG: ELWxxDGT repeat protein [Isosphaerales bacterium]
MLSGAQVSLVKDINQIDSSPVGLTNVDGKLFFLTTDRTAGTASVWASDGTTSGTVELMSRNVSTYAPGYGQSTYPSVPSGYPFVASGGKVYFTAPDSNGAPGLFETDGTAAGTVEVAPLTSPAGNLTAADGKIYFTEQDSSSTTQLWVSDGTAAGTMALTSFTTGGVSGQLTAIGNDVYFEPIGSGGGPTQLWTSDGTSAGTVELVDFGANGAVYNNLTDLNGTVYFTGNDGTDGVQLWRSDGTVPGTVAVTDFSGESLYSLQSANGALYFLASDGSATGGVPDGSEQLWTSDGTSTGTVQLTHWTGGISQVGYFTAVGGTTFFTATDSSASNAPDGTDLWEIKGGTAAPVATSIPWAAGPTDLTALNDTTLLFWADGGNGAGTELWESNGTASGTVMVKDINPGSAGSYLSGQSGEYSLLVGPHAGLNQLTVINGVAYFGADDGTHGDELWESDGTAAGTTLVKDIDPGSASSAPQELTDLNGTLYFVAHDGTGPNQLWESDGSTAGTVVVQNFTPAQTWGSYPANLTNIGGNLFFTATDGIDGEQLWRSDGTASGTTMLTDFANTGASATTSGSYFQDLLDLNGKLIFEYGLGASNTIYESDGTAAGTVPIFTTSSSVSDPTVVGNSLYFLTTGTGSDGFALWVTDGTASGAQELVSFPSGSSLEGGQGGSNQGGPLVNADGTLFFEVNNSGSSGTGEQLWTSNGTVAGTVEVTEISGNSYTPFGELVALGSNLVFTENDPTTDGGTSGGESIWLSDGTASGTIELADFPAPTSSIHEPPATTVSPIAPVVPVVPVVPLGGAVPTPVGPVGPVVPPGIATPTLVVPPGGAVPTPVGPVGPVVPPGIATPTLGGIGPGLISNLIGPGLISNLTVSGGTVYFTAQTTSGEQLWASDGTAAGTVPLTSNSTTSSSTASGGINPTNLTNVNGILFFQGSDPTTGDASLWASNGTVAGTVELSSPGSSLAPPYYLMNLNGKALFLATDPATGSEALWSSDGTVAGTSVVADLPGTIGTAYSTPNLTNAVENGTLYFVVNSSSSGPDQLWKSDGTASGTTEVANLPQDSGELTAAGPTLFFGAIDDHGAELWSAQLGVSTTPAVTWANPADITYGTALGADQLDAMSNVPGAFTYTPAAGTVLPAGAGQTLMATFTPTDTTDYTTATGSATINVLTVTPAVTWANPAGITYGTALGADQLDATSSVPGTFTYTPAAGTVLPAGAGQTLMATFTPTDTTDYTTATGSATINVLTVTPTVTWANPANITYGTALGAGQLDAASNVPGTFTYSAAAGTVLHAGAGQTLTATFTPTDTTNYTTAAGSVTINVLKVTPKVTWANPADITFGTALGAGQLDATSNVPGIFTYSAAAGTVLPSGPGKILSVTFTPTDTIDYTAATSSTTINVVTPTATPTATVTPTIIGEQAVFLRTKNKRGKPVGKPVLAGYTIEFNTKLNASSATDTGNYQVDSVNTKRVKRQVEPILRPIGFTVSYDAASESVSVMMPGKQTFRSGGQITVLGGATSGVSGVSGGFLSGNKMLIISPGGKNISAA